MTITREQRIFLPTALAVAVSSIIGFDVYARMSIRSEAFLHALYETLYYGGIQLFGTIWLLTPFFIIGMISSSAAMKNRVYCGWCFFVFGALPTMLIYLRGYISEARLMEAKKWTASIFAVAFLPVMCSPIIIVMGGALLLFKMVERKMSQG